MARRLIVLALAGFVLLAGTQVMHGGTPTADETHECPVCQNLGSALSTATQVAVAIPIETRDPTLRQPRELPIAPQTSVAPARAPPVSRPV